MFDTRIAVSERLSVPAIVDDPADAIAVVVLAHGAGARHDHPGMTALAAALGARDLATVRFSFPYAAAGRRLPGLVVDAVATWRAAMAAAAVHAGSRPVFAAGRSYGGRMASVAAAEGAIDPAGLICLSYPLHPPGRPDAPRTAHLPAIAQPQLFVSGTADPFVHPHEQLTDAVGACQDATLVWVPGDHSPPAEPVAAAATEWIHPRVGEA